MTKKYKSFLNRNIFSILQILSCILLIVAIVFPRTYKIQQQYGNGNNSITTPFKKDTTIEGTFISKSDYMNQVGIVFSTFTKKNETGSINIIIADTEQNPIKEINEDIKNLIDNQTYYIEFDEIKDSKNKLYHINITCQHCTEEVSLTTWYSDSNNNKEYTVIDGVKSEKVLTLTTSGKKKDYTYTIFPVLLLALSSTLKTLKENEKNNRNI